MSHPLGWSLRRGLATVSRLTAVGLGAAQLWAAIRYDAMNEDGIAYLDMGDALIAADWGAAVNSVWSPLYPLVQGAIHHLVSPPLRWEFALVHVVNFAIYLLALGCFEFFWKRLGEQRSETGWSEPAWNAVGSALFVWSALCWIKIWAVTPDMLMAALVYLAAGLLLGLGRTGATIGTFAGLGFVLGLGYLTKSVMFPIAAGFLVMALAVGRQHPRWRLGMVTAVLVFLGTAGPFVTAISLRQGRFTFGEAGGITYLKHVLGVPYPHWVAGAHAELGAPVHPARRLLDRPPVYEFGEPIAGTYPMGYDPAYWYEGVAPRFDWSAQRAALVRSGAKYVQFVTYEQAGLVAVLLLLFLLDPPTVRSRALRDPRWALIAIGAAALVLYAVVYVETRYVAAFTVLGWGGLLALAMPGGTRRPGVARASAMVLVGTLLLNVAAFHVGQAVDTRALPAKDPCEDCVRATPWRIADELRRQGLEPGDRIGFIGYSFGAFFARLGRLRITAEIPAREALAFWEAGETKQAEAMEAFRRAGVKAVLTDYVPGRTPPSGWTRIGRTMHYAYFFPY